VRGREEGWYYPDEVQEDPNPDEVIRVRQVSFFRGPERKAFVSCSEQMLNKLLQCRIGTVDT